jgi:hypothetical protein
VNALSLVRRETRRPDPRGPVTRRLILAPGVAHAQKSDPPVKQALRDRSFAAITANEPSREDERESCLYLPGREA